MMTEATRQALSGLRELSTLQWYAIPILALVLSGRSALWAAPGPTALRTILGWNLEIMRKTAKGEIMVVALPYAAALALDLIAACLGWRY
jgi:hypothetical protein